jgi:replicative DNA helicase
VISNEQAVIAAVLLDSRVLRSAAAECSPSDFADMRLGDIFRGVTAMFAAREPIDVITVSDKLAGWDVRGVTPADLHSWISEIPTASNVAFYAAAVRSEALRRGLRKIATEIVQEVESADPGVVMANTVDRVKALRESSSAPSMELKMLGDVLLGEDDYDWVVPDLLERSDRFMLTGAEGSGKSMLVRQIAIMASAGLHPFTFFRQEPVKVLVVDAENTEKQWRRSSRPMVSKAALRGAANPADVMGLWCAPRLDLTKDSDLSDVHQALDDLKPDLLVIGPLYRLIPKAINSDDDAAPLLAALDTLRDRGVAMIIEAHAGHAVGGGGEREMRPRGSAALMGWPEFGLGLMFDKGGRGSNEFKLVRWRGDRDQRRWPARISRGVSDWPWTPTVEMR